MEGLVKAQCQCNGQVQNFAGNYNVTSDQLVLRESFHLITARTRTMKKSEVLQIPICGLLSLLYMMSIIASCEKPVAYKLLIHSHPKPLHLYVCDTQQYELTLSRLLPGRSLQSAYLSCLCPTRTIYR